MRHIPTEPLGEHMHAGARAGFRMGARACVGLPPAGREAGRTCGRGRLSLGLAALGRLDLGEMAVRFCG